MNHISFAVRNILRYKRRSIITIAAIMIGFTAINLFGGYTANTFKGLQESAIYGEGIGHLTIFKKGFLTEGKLDPKKYMITREEMAKIAALAAKNPHIKLLVPKLDTAGLISNGTNSTIFIAQGVDPDELKRLKGDFKYEGQGTAIDSKNPTGIQVGSDLARIMNLKLGDTASIMANTLDGQMNALDVQVLGIYNTGADATNDKTLVMPIKQAQSLYNTDSVDRIAVVLYDVKNTEATKKWFRDNLSSIGFDAEIKTWNELSVFYTKVRGLFDLIFMFIFSIVLLIVVTSVVNTMTMSVVERTREIGTLRSLGLRKLEVLKLFGTEGFVLGLAGVCSGILCTILFTLIIYVSNLKYIPPGSAQPVNLHVDLVIGNMLASGLFLIFICLLAAIFPSRKASRLEIVDALGHL